MGGFQKFGDLTLEKIGTYEPGLDRDELYKSIIGCLKGVEIEPSQRRLTEYERFYIEIFRCCVDISNSLENLSYIPIFIYMPFDKYKYFKDAGITRIKYLRYHIEHYLEENYILENRVVTLLNKLSRQLRREGRVEETKLILDIRGSFKRAIKGITDIRGSHVHEIRFDDDTLNRLTGFEIASDYTQDKDLELESRFLYTQAKKEWCELIVNNNRSLREVMDNLFEKLIPIVFPCEDLAVR